MAQFSPVLWLEGAVQIWTMDIEGKRPNRSLPSLSQERKKTNRVVHLHFPAKRSGSVNKRGAEKKRWPFVDLYRLHKRADSWSRNEWRGSVRSKGDNEEM